ncbi:MAG: SRPBCC family protein [Wenzhouxiangellaceae bacterium]
MTIEDRIYIEAPSNLVWNISTDIEHWSEWTPTVTSIVRLEGGRFGLGKKACIDQSAFTAALSTECLRHSVCFANNSGAPYFSMGDRVIVAAILEPRSGGKLSGNSGWLCIIRNGSRA